MSRLFISHSSKNDDWAIALKDWLVREGWSGSDDIFLDLDPERGVAAGQRWVHALEDAATRCEGVLFLVSEKWLASKWCTDEYQLANRLNKKLFALLIDDIALDRLPGGLTAQWQIVRLKGETAERFVTVHPLTQRQSPVHIAEAGLKSLKRGLDKAGIGAETFELHRDQNGPFGWRAPYRGLEALEPEDAAVFFGRSADIVRGIDILRGLAARKPPRLLVILGASGAGKSSFLRAGLWPRLLRDDSQWLPLKAIRASRGGAVEGSEGLLAALEDVHRRFALQVSRADLRDRLATPDSFLTLLRELRQTAAKRALIAAPPEPLPVLCLDQGEEVFAASAALESEKFLQLARAAVDGNGALLLVSIRSDSYGAMQGAKALAGIDQVPLSLGPVPHGEIAHLIREPAKILRRKAGPAAPLFDEAVIARLQNEVEGEADALPLLAFVLQRLMREHQGTATIGLAELERTGGIAAAIEQTAEAALDDAGIGDDRAAQRDALRRLFIPRLARIDHDSKTPQRRVAQQREVPRDLLPLARALTQRRLLVVKAAAQMESIAASDGTTLEVAHEALLRRWPTLAELLAEDRDALLLLDGVLSAAADWEKAGTQRKTDFLIHLGSRLLDAQALAARGGHWAREITPARPYLAACAAREAAERKGREAKRRRLLMASFAAIVVLGVIAVFAGVEWLSAQQALKTADVERDRARQALTAANDSAADLVFGVGSDFQLHRLAPDMLNQLLDIAIQGNDKVLDIDPTAAAYVQRGDAYALKGDFDHAIADLNQAISLDPKYARAYTGRGLIYHFKGNLDRAIADFDEAIRLNPTFVISYIDRGVAYDAKGNLKQAIADLNQAITLDPKSARAYLVRAQVYQRNNDWGHAIEDYTQAIALDSKLFAAYYYRGNAFRLKGDLNHAIADYSQAINGEMLLSADTANQYEMRGKAYDDKKDYDHAIADYTQAIALDPKKDVYFDDRGDAYKSKGDNDQAIADYTQAIALNPKDDFYFDDRGDAYRSKGDNDQAIADYTQAIALDPKIDLYYEDRGIANFYAGALPKALADLNEANELDPTDAYAALWLDIVSERSKLPSRLVHAMTQIDMTIWPAPIIRLYLGQLTREGVLAALDDPDTTTKNDQVCETNFFSGELALQQGAKDEAARLFRLAAADCPTTYASATAELKSLGVTP